MNDKKTVGELSIDTQLLIDRLKQCAVEEIVTYKTLNSIIKRSVQGEAYHNLSSARRHLQRNDGIVFEAIINHGLKRLNSNGIVESGSRDMKALNRKARRNMIKLNCAELEKLDEEQKLKNFALMSLNGALYTMSKVQSIKKIEQIEPAEKISFKGTLELFYGKE